MSIGLSDKRRAAKPHDGFSDVPVNQLDGFDLFMRRQADRSMENGKRPNDLAVRISNWRRPARPVAVLKCDVAEVCPYWVCLDVDRVDGTTQVSRCCARPMGQANLNAVTGTAIGCWNGRSGTIGKPFAVSAQQKDACKHIIPTHLLD